MRHLLLRCADRHPGNLPAVKPRLAVYLAAAVEAEAVFEKATPVHVRDENGQAGVDELLQLARAVVEVAEPVAGADTCAPLRWPVVFTSCCLSTPFLWCLPKETGADAPHTGRELKLPDVCGADVGDADAPRREKISVSRTE